MRTKHFRKTMAKKTWGRKVSFSGSQVQLKKNERQMPIISQIKLIRQNKTNTRTGPHTLKSFHNEKTGQMNKGL